MEYNSDEYKKIKYKNHHIKSVKKVQKSFFDFLICSQTIFFSLRAYFNFQKTFSINFHKTHILYIMDNFSIVFFYNFIFLLFFLKC
jgi:hypothetical protein